MNNVLYSSNSEEWSTPQEFFDKLDAIWHFDLDVCASNENHKCEKYFTKDDDALQQDWSGHSVFMNPPYGKNIGRFMKKAYEESRNGCNVICIIPARTDTKWFHEWVYNKASSIIFVRGRLKFGEAKNNAPFPVLVIEYKAKYGAM